MNKTIYGKRTNGLMLAIPVVSDEMTVDDMKTYISQKLEIYKEDIYIILCGESLKNKQYLRDTKIFENNFHIVQIDSTIFLSGKSLQGLIIQVPVVYKRDTVATIKAYISEKLCIKKEKLIIILCGVVLTDDLYLRDCELTKHPWFDFIEKS